MDGLSLVVITHNEESNIGRCLDSVEGIANEIIVIDSFSEDRTKEISQNYTNLTFVQRRWAGYSSAKNKGIELAKYGHILSLDADEALSESARRLLKPINLNPNQAISFNRLNNYCGRWIYFSGWYPDKRIRVFPKRGSYWEGEYVHEKLKMRKDVLVTEKNADILHYTYNTIEEHKEKSRAYALLSANKKGVESQFWLVLSLMFGPFFKLLKSYIVHLGVLEGRAGWNIATISAWEVFLKNKYALSNKNRTKSNVKHK